MDQHIDEHDECESKTPTRNIIFGKYEVGRVLGQGTFAKVYYGRNDASNENVAIKVMSKEEVRKAGMVEAIEREISVMRLVRHPNVVGLKEVLATKGRIYFIMEYVKGGELFSKIAKGRLKEEYARKYFQQLISAIDYCHSRGVSHRDLKPENLLLDENENLKVTDFGLSALPEHLRQDGLLHTQCGTPAYVAPEVLRKKGYDGAKADIWSCGVILFALLSGYLPFQDVNLMKMYRKIFKGEYEFPPWFPPDAKRLVSKLLVVDPNRRLSIQGIMRQPWFRKDPLSSSLAQPLQVPEHQQLVKEPKVASPRFFNAFEFISSMSSGFDLSSLFESKKKSGSMFTSKCSASAIMAKFKGLAMAKKMNVEVSWKESKVKMQGREEGRKGRLQMTAEVFEVAAEVTVVELSKCSGDTLEYVKFCEEGTFGTVHRGIYDSLDVAVKLLDWGEEGQRTAAEIASLRAAFTQEVAVWHKLNHPNVTKFIGAKMGASGLQIQTESGLISMPTNICCVVVEYLPGGALKNYLIKNRRKKLAFKVVHQLALDLARGLSYLHSEKIVHRDVKTENMLLDKSRTLKIADFGVARVEASNPSDMTGETGTLGYMAPEVLNGDPYNRKCDVYSFGICLWEIYCCDMPYPDLSFSEVTSAVVRQNLRPEIPRCCPSALANVMKKCWDANPDRRPEMDEVVSLLEAIDTSKGGGMIPVDQQQSCFCFQRRRGP